MADYAVVVADDHQIVRDGIRDILADAAAALNHSFRIVAEAGDGLATLAAVKTHRPDLLTLDISMPLASGLEIMADIKRWSPATRVLVFSGVIAPGMLASAMDSGVSGLFSKAAAPADLIEHLPVILAGGRYVAPDLVAVIEQGRRTVPLTDRERQALSMLLAGKSNKEMAQLLNISPKTVEKHRASLMQKLEVHSIAELMARALQEGLIDGSNRFGSS